MLYMYMPAFIIEATGNLEILSTLTSPHDPSHRERYKITYCNTWNGIHVLSVHTLAHSIPTVTGRVVCRLSETKVEKAHDTCLDQADMMYDPIIVWYGRHARY